MRNIITHSAILFIICIFISSCEGGGELEEPTIIGDWHTYERTLQTSDPDINNRFNLMFKIDLDNYINITKSFGEQNVKTVVRKKGTESANGLIQETTDSYQTIGDSLFIEDSLTGELRRSKYIISQKILTTYQIITSKDLIKMAPDMGVSPELIPEGLVGVLKTQDKR